MTELTYDARPLTHRRLSGWELLAVGLGTGLISGVVMAAPLVIWDWVRTGHRALELPMAATSWLFGLRHFSHTGNLAWPILVGVALLCAYWIVSGISFTALADRVFAVEGPLASTAAGLAWGFVDFVFFWYMLLPIARNGVPFRVAPGDAGLFVAPNWVWILGFTLLGLASGLCYAALRGPTRQEEMTEDRGRTRRPLRHAA